MQRTCECGLAFENVFQLGPHRRFCGYARALKQTQEQTQEQHHTQTRQNPIALSRQSPITPTRQNLQIRIRPNLITRINQSPVHIILSCWHVEKLAKHPPHGTVQ